MIPFFRKIRWRLAADNQFLKYSRYAIGEIVLVVIGILIALYINDWNEGRKDSEKKDFYTQALLNDLRQDTLQIRRFLKELDELEPVYKNCKFIIEKEDSTIDTLISLFCNTNTYLTPELEPQNDSAIKSLLSTGEINIFDKHESSDVLDFYEDTEYSYKLIQEWDNQTYRIRSQFYNDYGWLTKGENNWFIYDRARENIDEIKFAIDFDVYITQRDYWMPFLRRHAELILDSTDKMLQNVESM